MDGRTQYNPLRKAPHGAERSSVQRRGTPAGSQGPVGVFSSGRLSARLMQVDWVNALADLDDWLAGPVPVLVTPGLSLTGETHGGRDAD